MIIAGKCPPEPDELAAAAERGFEHVELYLEKQHLDNFEATIAAVQDAPVEVVSIHTPHVTLKEKEYIAETDRLATELDAVMVVHSQFIQSFHVPAIEELSLNAAHGYENNPAESLYALENLVLGRGQQLVLDVAHLFMAEPDYQAAIAELLAEYGDRIPVIHLADAVPTDDGLPFGAGDMDLEAVVQTIVDSEYDGILVVEVMPEHQEAAREQVQQIVSSSSSDN